MNKKDVTIAIVKYPGLNEKWFTQSLSAAFAQICCNAKVKIFLDGVIYDNDDKRLNIEPVPVGLHGDIPGIREYIVKNNDTDYLAFWDADDVFSVTRIHNQMKIIKENNLDMCFSDFKFFNDETIFKTSFFDMIGFNNRKINIIDENFIPFGNIIAKTDFLRTLLPFPKIKMLDWWIGIRAFLNKANVAHCSGINAFYRVKEDSLSRRFVSVRKKDFADEKSNKIELYENLKDKSKIFSERLSYFKTLDVENKFQILKTKYEAKLYKNIWGGLIDYEG